MKKNANETISIYEMCMTSIFLEEKQVWKKKNPKILDRRK